MGKATAQGTRHESAIRTRATLNGRVAQRNAKRGQKHESDVTITGREMLGAVFWKAYLPTGGRRKTVPLVVMHEEDWWKLYALDTESCYGVEIQAKAAQRVGIVGVLIGLLDWMKR